MNFTAEQPKIIVVGSSSIDLVLDTEALPRANETVIASKSESFFGGKGANQAVAAARLGASVYFIGCVGMDPYGQQIMRNLVDEGVNVGFVGESEEVPSGTAYVTTVDGTNTIVVVPASNATLKPEHVAEAEKFFSTADLILVQLEIPQNVVEYTINLTAKYGKKIGLYAAPARKLSSELLEKVSFIVAKSTELTTLFGEKRRDQLLATFANRLFVRDDANSTTFFDGAEMRYLSNTSPQAHHKMGMGDAFSAGFAIALCHGNTVEDCVKFGNEVSLRVAEKRGSQIGLPFLKDFS